MCSCSECMQIFWVIKHCCCCYFLKNVKKQGYKSYKFLTTLFDAYCIYKSYQLRKYDTIVISVPCFNTDVFQGYEPCEYDKFSHVTDLLLGSLYTTAITEEALMRLPTELHICWSFCHTTLLNKPCLVRNSVEYISLFSNCQQAQITKVSVGLLRL